MALDLSINTGYAIGRPGAHPRSGSVRLKRRDEPEQIAWRNLGCWLRDQFAFEPPNFVVYEAALDPAAMRELGNSGRTITLQWGHVAAVEAICGPLGIRTQAVNVQTVRKHFTGRARWGERDEAKRAVIARCHTLSLMPRDCRDNNRADAIAVHDWACATFGRRTFRQDKLVMFGERADGV